jgi:hypothetical protein
MTQRNLLLAGAASLTVVALVALPVNAQNLPRYSTPEEHAQTETLNADQASVPGIVVASDPAAEANYRAAKAAHDAALAQQQTAQSQYNDQLKDYAQKSNQYTEERRQYQDRVDTYEVQSGQYEDAPSVVIVDDPPLASATVEPPVVEEHHVLVYPDRSSLVHLDDLANPDEEIGGVAVEDRFGNVVGRFRHMTLQDEGAEKAVITLHNNKSVAVREDHLRFDPDRAIVVADIGFDELNRLPARF